MAVSQLVKKAKKGNKDALLQLVMEQQDDYYKLAYTYMKNIDDALDALEDMIVTLYEKIYQLKKPDSFYSWSKTILVNCCRSNLRKRNRVILVDEWMGKDLEDDIESNQSYKNSEQRMYIQQLLACLNTEQEETIKLRYFHDMDYQTIAELMNVSLGTVKSRIHQSLKKMKEHYGGEADE